MNHKHQTIYAPDHDIAAPCCIVGDGKHSGPASYGPDTQGQHINAHGGGVLIYQNKYYWFGEYKSDNTSSALVGVTCYSSSDLVHWRNRGIALSVSSELGSEIERGCINRTAEGDLQP
jgi:hypothetical protein